MQTESDLRLAEIVALKFRLDGSEGRKPPTQQTADPLDLIRGELAELDSEEQRLAADETNRDTANIFGIISLVASRQSLAARKAAIRDDLNRAERAVRAEEGRQRLHALLSR
jgi:hypothetical protein